MSLIFCMLFYLAVNDIAFCPLPKGQLISKAIYGLLTSPKKRTISSFKYFRVVRIEKQICSFVFWEKLQARQFCFEIY